MHLHEQVPYLEWRNSPSMTKSIRINQRLEVARVAMSPDRYRWQCNLRCRPAHNPGGRDFPFLNPREPYGRHTFAGGKRLHDAVAA